jgi:hypothetical protein
LRYDTRQQCVRTDAACDRNGTRSHPSIGPFGCEYRAISGEFSASISTTFNAGCTALQALSLSLSLVSTIFGFDAIRGKSVVTGKVPWLIGEPI